MKLLIISEDKTIFEEKSESRNNILNYASFLDNLFVVVANKTEKKSDKISQIAENAWIYKTHSFSKLFRVFKIYRLASFELKARGIFQPDLIMCEDQFISTFAGYLLSKKFKRPLYINISEINERKFFFPKGIKRIFLSKILLFILNRSNYVKVDSQKTREKILKKYPHLYIDAIKPYFDLESLIDKADKNLEKLKKTKKDKFTTTAFVNTKEQVNLAVDILRKLNMHYPPSILTLLPSDDLQNKNLMRLVNKNLRPFVIIEKQKEKWSEVLINSNIFFGISKDEEYESALTKACIIGVTIIAKEDETSKNLIEDNSTGFLCPLTKKDEVVEYFENKTLYLMKNPSISLTFKMNIPLSFKQQFSDTKEEYTKKLKSSWEDCFKKYKEDHLKYYRY